LHLKPTRVCAADRYAPTADLSIVTAYFNPAGFRSRRRNYELFCDRIHAAGIPLITVECALGDRRYVDRNQELAGFGFDPAADVRVGSDGCWEWANRKPALHRWAAAYLSRRREDGDDTGGEADGTV
jgi:hypothetical protein